MSSFWKGSKALSFVIFDLLTPPGRASGRSKMTNGSACQKQVVFEGRVRVRGSSSCSRVEFVVEVAVVFEVGFDPASPLRQVQPQRQRLPKRSLLVLFAERAHLANPTGPFRGCADALQRRRRAAAQLVFQVTRAV